MKDDPKTNNKSKQAWRKFQSLLNPNDPASTNQRSTEDPKTKAMELYEPPFEFKSDSMSIVDSKGKDVFSWEGVHDPKINGQLYQGEPVSSCFMNHAAQALNEYWERNQIESLEKELMTLENLARSAVHYGDHDVAESYYKSAEKVERKLAELRGGGDE
jgi:hypothetical protein